MDEEIYVDLQGQEQYLLIKGRDVKNPVILYLHGGPSAPDSVLVHEWSPCLTDEYTLVAWDQRGCGKTYYRIAVEKGKDTNKLTAAYEKVLQEASFVC